MPTTTMHTTTATTAISRIGATSFSMRRTSMASAVSNSRVGRKMTRKAWDEMWKLDSAFRKSVTTNPAGMSPRTAISSPSALPARASSTE